MYVCVKCWSIIICSFIPYFIPKYLKLALRIVFICKNNNNNWRYLIGYNYMPGAVLGVSQTLSNVISKQTSEISNIIAIYR